MPPKPGGWTADRMEIKKFRCQLKVDSHNSGFLALQAILDLKTSLPQSIITFACKQVVGVLIYLLDEAAKKISEDPEKNVHAKRVAEDPFYRYYLLERCNNDAERFGWKKPYVPSLAKTLSPIESPGSAVTDGGRSPEAIHHDAGTPNGDLPSPGKKKKNKNKKRRRWSLFKRGQKSSRASIDEAPASIFQLLTPKTTRPTTVRPKTTRRGSASSPFLRAEAPATFAALVIAHLLLQGALATFIRRNVGLGAEIFFALAGLMGLIAISASQGFFDPNYVVQLFTQTKEMRMQSVHILAAASTVAAGFLGTIIATFSTYRLQLVPREDVAPGTWNSMVASSVHIWTTIAAVAFVIVVVAPDAVRPQIIWLDRLLGCHDLWLLDSRPLSDVARILFAHYS